MKIARVFIDKKTLFGRIDGTNFYPLTNDIFKPPWNFSSTGYPLTQIKLLAPIQPSKILAIGRNFADHIAELNNTLPENPLIFFKPPTSVIGPEDAIPYPTWTSQLHYEAELAVIIAKPCTNISSDNIADYILGYTCALDITARDIQRIDIQWWRAKGADGFCPLGPWIETDLDPTHTHIQSFVNNEQRQNGSTQQMLGTVYDLLAYISTAVTLLPGDTVLTGTPAGVGNLAHGDTIEVRIAGIGSLINTVI